MSQNVFDFLSLNMRVLSRRRPKEDILSSAFPCCDSLIPIVRAAFPVRPSDPQSRRFILLRVASALVIRAVVVVLATRALQRIQMSWHFPLPFALV